MKTKTARPGWTGLYLLVGIVVGAFLWEARSGASAGVHRLREVLLLFVLFLLVEFWLRVNERALWDEEREQYHAEMAWAAAAPRIQEAEPAAEAAQGKRLAQPLTRLVTGWLFPALGAIASFLRHPDL